MQVYIGVCSESRDTKGYTEHMGLNNSNIEESKGEEQVKRTLRY